MFWYLKKTYGSSFLQLRDWHADNRKHILKKLLMSIINLRFLHFLNFNKIIQEISSHQSLSLHA